MAKQQGERATQPVKRFRSYGIEASVWEHDKGYSVTLRKSYKTDDGSYKETNTYFMDDLPRLGLVAAEAYRFIALKESE